MALFFFWKKEWKLLLYAVLLAGIVVGLGFSIPFLGWIFSFFLLSRFFLVLPLVVIEDDITFFDALDISWTVARG